MILKHNELLYRHRHQQHHPIVFGPTINQLAKHDILEYKKLIMMPDGHTDQEQFKESARAQLGQIDLCIGDRWGDIDADLPTIEHMCDTYGGGVNIVAKKFIKLAEQ